MSETVKPSISEVVKPIEVSPSRKIRVNLKESKLKESILSKDKMHGKPAWVVGSLDTFVQTFTSYKLLRKQTSQKCQCRKHKILYHLLVN